MELTEKTAKMALTPDLSDYLKTEDLTEFKDSTQYQFQTQSETILSLENRIILLESQLSGTTTITIFSACENALTLYGSELYTIYNSAYNSIADFAANYSHFFSADNDYQLSFSTDDFGWNGTVYVVCTKELSLTESSRILLTYLSGATEAGELFSCQKSRSIWTCPSPFTSTRASKTARQFNRIFSGCSRKRRSPHSLLAM